MIEPVLVKRLSAITLFLSLAVSSLALASGSTRVAGGIASGAVLGLLPIASWSILGSFLFSAKNPALFGVISLAKLLIYVAALTLLVARNVVDPLAFAGALLAPSLIMAALLSARRAGAAR